MRQFCHEIKEKVDIVADLDKITKAPHPLREVHDEHKQKLKVFNYCDGFDYSRGILTAKLQTILNGTDTAIGALPVSEDMNMRMKTTVQVGIVDLRHRFAALL